MEEDVRERKGDADGFKLEKSGDGVRTRNLDEVPLERKKVEGVTDAVGCCLESRDERTADRSAGARSVSAGGVERVACEMGRS